MSDPALSPPGEQPAPADRWSGARGDVVAVLGSLLLLGVACGVLWWLLVTPAEFTKVEQGGAMGEVALGRRFDADGWYVVLAVVGGLLSGAALTWWRSRDYLLTTGLLVVGSVLAAGVSAGVGLLLGPPDPDPVLAAAALGTRVPVQLEVAPAFHLLGVPLSTAYLAWPIAVLVGSLMVLWSKPLESEL